ncbi:Hydra magnipapillata [Seminavis robusta]|uniref:Hydra magnipapillata n=1 Tax=Seminavis robusta TaxID=568900 RepID=A0A9N8EKB6_9STRA|nr:Hydra magnipapillata [Seminavis robusta]|eukprot:Sro1402_g269590.1 Hydra magnipapillata (697) ;mRNA; r:23429-25519
MSATGVDVQVVLEGGGVVAAAPTNVIATSSTDAKNNSLSMDTLAVSVHHLEHIFLEEVYSFTTAATANQNPLSRDSKIYEIEGLRGPPGVIRTRGTNTICPVDGRLGASYVHCLQGDDHVGEATHMLSYSWNYTIGDIVDTLSDFCLQNNLNPKRTYIWMCCLCVNQHRVVQNSAQQKSGMIASAKVDFFAIFGERVKNIGHLLAMMAPWKAPIYITRVWCIFEIFTAHRTGGCKVDIVMPPREKQSLEQDVVDNGEGINALYETLGNTKVEKANASVESDRLAILGQVKSDVGFAVLNNLVNDLLRGWMQGVLTQLVETRENTNDEEYVDFCNHIGVIFNKNGEHDAAMKLHQTALTICESVLGENHSAKAETYSFIGLVMGSMGDYEGALAKYEESLAINLSALGKNHPSVANTYNDIGFVLSEMGDHEGALAKYEEALAINLSALGKNHPDVAASYNNIGGVLRTMGEYEGALSKTEQALAIRLLALGKNHPDVANSYNNIGVILRNMGDKEGAFSKYEEALAIQESVLGKHHPEVAATYNNIGLVLDEIGDYEGALAKYKDALAIKESALGKDHPDVATCYNNIGSVMKAMGNYPGALSKYKQSLAILVCVLGKNHPLVASVYSNIGSVLCSMGNYSGALLKFEECLAIRKSVLGKNHPDTKACLEWIGCAKEALQQPSSCTCIRQLCCFRL